MAHNFLQEKFYDIDKKLFLTHSPKTLREKLFKEYGNDWSIHKSKTKQINEIKDFLESQRVYSSFKISSAKTTDRNSYHVYSIDQLWEIDLATIPKLAQANSGHPHILVCIDVFSRFAFAQPLRSKHPHEIVKALLKIFKSSQRLPYQIQSDLGTEFTSKVTQNFLSNRGIKFRSPKTTLPAKCSIVEAFNRTLKQRISRYLDWRHMTNQPEPNRYIDFLDKIIDDYNKTRHSRLHIAPINVTKENATQVYTLQKNMIEKKFKSSKPNSNPQNLHPNDFIRVKRKRKLFEKGTTHGPWSDEIFRIKRIIPRHPFTVFEISELDGGEIAGKLYNHEIQKLNIPPNTPIKILKRPSIFDRGKTSKVETLNGDIQDIHLESEKKKFKSNNYHDVVSSLTNIKNKKRN